MATCTNGTPVTFTLNGDQHFVISSNSSIEGEFTVFPVNGVGPKNTQIAGRFGPVAVNNQSFGPYGEPVTVTLKCVYGASFTYTLPATNLNNVNIGAGTAGTGAFTTLSASGATSLNPANASVTVSPTGTGTVTMNPATAGNINNIAVGQTTPAAVKTSNLAATYTDSSGTPGNVTNNSPRGRAAFAAAGSTVVVTSSLVTAASSVQVQLGGADATLNSVRVTTAAGSFTVTGNAAATGITPFDFLVVN